MSLCVYTCEMVADFSKFYVVVSDRINTFLIFLRHLIYIYTGKNSCNLKLIKIGKTAKTSIEYIHAINIKILMKLQNSV